MATLTASGIGSGIDVLSLVSQLVAAERQRPEQLLNDRASTLNSQISAIGQLKSSMSAFQDSLQKISSPNTFLVYNSSSSDTDVATVNASASAQQGSFDLVVTQLATAYKAISAGFADANTTEVGTGNITISNAKGDNFTLNFAGGGDNTLNEIRDAINESNDNFGVTATILNVDDGVGGITSKLVLSADDTGTDNALTVAADAGINALDTSNLTQIGTVLNAELTIDQQAITSSSNTISGAISGIDLELINAGSSTINTTKNVDAVVENVQEFVDAYNTLKNTLTELASYKDGNPGALFGDATVRSFTSQLDNILYSTVGSVTGNYNSLTSVGISSNAYTAELSLNSDTLKNALAADFDGISKLFTATDGIAANLDDTLTSYTQFAGLLDTKKESLNTRLSMVDESRDRLDYRLGKLEARLTAQFIAMDGLVQTLNSTGNFLTQQLANLPGVANNTK